MMCPRCKQGDVVEARVRRSDDVLFICEECEATWFAAAAIGNAAFMDFGDYMQKFGLKPLWEELIVTVEK